LKKLSKIKLQTYNQSQHGIDTGKISPSAQAIITKLIENNYQAYIVGGAVRDLLLNKQPKDFDIATNATPDEIKAIFKRECRIIGRRFRLAHVYCNHEMYEVATFRGSQKHSQRELKKGQIVRDNVFGTIDQDALRRDFSCNALYFDIQNANILDYCNGYKDISENQLKFIGNDCTRIIEDPVRMIRAIRFQAKLGLKMSKKINQATQSEHQTIANVSPARLFDELVKLFHCSNGIEAYRLMKKFNLFQFIFPKIHSAIDKSPHNKSFIERAFNSTDSRIAQGKSITPVFLFACFMWPFAREIIDRLENKKVPLYEAVNTAANETFIIARSRLAIPKVIQIGIRNIWLLQYRFNFTKGKRVFSTLENPRFRAAYDFLLLRQSENPELETLVQWWTDIQKLSAKKQKELIFPPRVKKIKLSSKSHTCYLGLGSNVGESQANIKKALKLIDESAHITTLETAGLYLTKPWGKTDQQDFINTAIKIRTRLKPVDLLEALKMIEIKLGRTKTEKWGPRVIDIDILLYGNNVVKQQHLEIPHPHITERSFVIVPLLELNNEIIIPKKGKLGKYYDKKSEANSIIKKI